MIDSVGWGDRWITRLVRGQAGGLSYREKIPPRIVLHTTEGSRYEGAFGAYDRGTGAPHVTAEYRRDVVFQHVPLNRGARSLRNGAGGIQPNASRTFQIEWVQFAQDVSDGKVSDAEYKWLAERVIQPIIDFEPELWPLRAPTFKGVDQAYGRSSETRVSNAVWRSNQHTFYGHQHVPDTNTHWDPGAFDFDKLLSYLRPPSGETVTPEQADELILQMKGLNARLDSIADETRAQFAQINSAVFALDKRQRDMQQGSSQRDKRLRNVLARVGDKLLP